MDDEERWKISLSNSPFVLGVVTLLNGWCREKEHIIVNFTFCTRCCDSEKREKGDGMNVTLK
jgi:hypothetical protein